jgi:DNA repair protein RecN (Recombination protein N)
MLMHLSVKNLALIDHINLDFDKGLNILTGETGAGKSIIIDAVNLILGDRADRDLIQTGKDYALVEALFDISNHPHMTQVLDDLGIEMEQDGSLLLVRELSAGGKNICRINGRIVTLSILKNISKFLVDIHGQHEHQSLLRVEEHRELLDMLGGAKLSQAKEKVKELYDSWKEIHRKIKKLSHLELDGERRKDILQYQINEIESANLKEDEEEGLIHERDRLNNAERIISVINSVYQDIYSGSNSYHSAFDVIGNAVSQFKQIADIDPILSSLNQRLEEIFYLLEDIVFEVRNYRDEFEHDPYRLDEIEKRLETIRSLKRKYGPNISDIFSYLDDIKEELNTLENSQEILGKLLKQEEDIFNELLEACHILSKYRKETAKIFEDQLQDQLTELGMEKALFKVNIESIDNLSDTLEIKDRLTPNGYDMIEFMISTNPGEPVKPLSKIVSGGEMSRIMLAFKTILAQVDDIPTLIFDEIDVGISGNIAHVVGEKMGNISRTRQVICVTHLPQIAAMADSHYKIEKLYMDKHTRTIANKLNNKQRQEEIARMTGGKTLSKINMKHASELIRMAQEYKRKIV